MRTVYSILIFAAMPGMASCQNATNAQAQNSISKELQVADYDQKLKSTPGAQLVDVRTPEEYAEGHLAHAVNIDYRSDAFAAGIAKLDKKKPVFVYCLSGGRSGMAASQMRDLGFSEVYNMKGGIMKWKAADKPVVTGSEAKRPKGMSRADFDKATAEAEYVLVDYHAKWCAPCKEMAPYLQSLAERNKGKLLLRKIDADENQDLLKEKGIESIPYLELYHKGKIVWQHQGYIDEGTLRKETKL